MGETQKPIAFQGPGQVPAPASPPAEQPQGNASQPEYITRQEAQRMAEDAAEAAFRKAQGLLDKRSDGLLKKVQTDIRNIEQAIDLQKKAGIVITPEQEDKLKQQAYMRALSESESAPQPGEGATSSASPAPAGAPAAQPAAQVEPLDPVSAEALNMMQVAGVSIEESDPEYQTIDQNSPYRFLKSVEAAIVAKKARLASNPQPSGAPTRTPTNLGSTGVHNPNPNANIRDPRELYRRGFGGQ